MEGKFQYYFANPRVRIQETPEGSAMVKTTLIGPDSDMDEARDKYFLAYPPGGYDTKIIYEGTVVSEKNKKERVYVFSRYSSCD